MWKRFSGVPVVVVVACGLASCNTAAKDAAAPAPEAEQTVSSALKDLYMAASAAAPQSAEQQKIILQMAVRASNAKELLLTMRAAIGVFPASTGSKKPGTESQVCSLVTAKMMQFGTLDQLIEYASQYPVDPAGARPFVKRMFHLVGDTTNPHVWYRIKTAAYRLKVSDLERQAQTRADQLAGRKTGG
jgi:hypothetical protein